MTAELHGEAERIARHIVDSVSGVEAVCLFGSVARGDSSEFSDIDLLVIGSDPEMTPSKLLKVVPRRDRRRRISVLYYTTEDFRQHCREGALFIAHVHREGEILYDKSGLLQNVLSGSFTAEVDTQRALEVQLERLEPYEDTQRFNGNFLFCLSHLYAIGKGVVMLKLVEAGSPEFNRERAFQAFGERHPNLRRELRKITRLRPFFNLVTRRQPESLPFSYRDAQSQVLESVRAIRKLARVQENEQVVANQP